jgi:hypothetical protein
MARTIVQHVPVKAKKRGRRTTQHRNFADTVPAQYRTVLQWMLTSSGQVRSEKIQALGKVSGHATDRPKGTSFRREMMAGWR